VHSNEYSYRGGPARRTAQLGLCLVLFAGLATACGSGKPSGSTQPATSPTASAQGSAASMKPAATPNVEAYKSDSGGYGTLSGSLSAAGYTDRYEGIEGLDHMAEGYAIIEAGLPKATDLNKRETADAGTISGDVSIFWQPRGRRDTLLPPGGHGDRASGS
jgi:hypothetical protein